MKKCPEMQYNSSSCSCNLWFAHVRESTKVLDSGSQLLDFGSHIWILDFNPLDSGFQPFGFRISYQSGFRIPNHCGFRILVVSGFRIPTANICWIPDSGFSYMGRRGGDFLCFWSILGQFSRDFRLFARAAPYSNVFLPVSNDSILT